MITAHLIKSIGYLPIWFVCLNSCTISSQPIEEWAKQSSVNKIIVSTSNFKHVLYYKVSSRDKKKLHIYIEGDGRPWLTPKRIALEPSINKPVMLPLMAMDSGPVLYLGRPCYMGLSSSTNCHPWYWTSGRYSEEVVASMQNALNQFLNDKAFTELVFIGHSGGGALAMLLAKRFSLTSTVVTIAGNIDTQGWTRHHAYSPLVGLNPARQLPLQKKIHQYHLMGANDTTIPNFLTINVLKNQPNTQLITIPDYTHRCCWKQIWARVLNCIENTCERLFFPQPLHKESNHE